MPNVRIGDVDLASGNSGNVARGDDILISRGGVDRRAHLNGKLLLPAFTVDDAGKKLVVNSTGTALVLVEDEVRGVDTNPTLGTLTGGETWAQRYSSLLIRYTTNLSGYTRGAIREVWVPVAPNTTTFVGALRNGFTDTDYANTTEKATATFTINSTMTEISITYYRLSASNITYYAFK